MASFNTQFGLFNSGEGQDELMQLLLSQISRLEGQTGPEFADVSGAFGEARGAARSRQAGATSTAQANALERAAAKGKTLSSAQTAAQSRIGQEGANALSSILADLGIQEQGILGEQAVATSRFEEGRRGQINDLLGLLGSLGGSSGPAAPAPLAAPAQFIPTPSGADSPGIGRNIPAPQGPASFDIGSLFGPLSGSEVASNQGFGAQPGAAGLFQSKTPSLQDIFSRLGNITAEQAQIVLPLLAQFLGQQSDTVGSLLGARNAVV